MRTIIGGGGLSCHRARQLSTFSPTPSGKKLSIYRSETICYQNVDTNQMGNSTRYFVSKLDIDAPVSIFIYFTYMLMISLGFFLLTGSIGFFSCLWFVRKIYGAIKVD